MQLNRHLQQFAIYQKRDAGRSETTVATYQRYLVTFFTHAGITEPRHITRATVAAFAKHLGKPMVGSRQAEVVRTTKTQNYYRIALRSFLKYLASRNIASLPFWQVTLLKDTHTVPSPKLTFRDIARWRAQPDLATLVGCRDHAIIELMLATGLAVSVVCSLTRTSCDTRRGTCTVTNRMGQEVSLPLTKEARAALRQYQKKRHDTSPWLFIQHKTNSRQPKSLQLSARSVERRCDYYRVAAGIVHPVTPKAVRQYVAKELSRQGMSLHELQERMGHQHRVSTEKLIVEAGE